LQKIKAWSMKTQFQKVKNLNGEKIQVKCGITENRIEQDQQGADSLYLIILTKERGSPRICGIGGADAVIGQFPPTGSRKTKMPEGKIWSGCQGMGVATRYIIGHPTDAWILMGDMKTICIGIHATMAATNIFGSKRGEVMVLGKLITSTLEEI